MNQVLEFIHNGGVMMYPLILCSIILISLTLERAITFRKLTTDGDDLLDEIKELYKPGGDPTRAIEACEKQGILGMMFARGLRNSAREPDAIEMALEFEAASEIPNLEANLPVVKTIVNIAPLLGLLGTIFGMIASFRVASAAGLSNPTQILGGISEALVSTASGITVAIIGFLVHNYFANLGKKTMDDLEYYGAEFVNYVSGRVD
ncbi:MAG: MotA/TolQ/ExbB proton channel family protein [Armatimonadetes bacterium]|nr:MotA/TolQ/ExbB proton channel family protein [Armatimonadota bacterium]